jgi:hypothetical protein
MKTLKNQKTENLGYFNYSLLYDETVKSNIEKWIVALRSGEFKQGRRCLHDKLLKTYCCLGVANEVCQLNETSDQVLLGTHKLMGLVYARGAYVLSGKTEALSSMNDSGKFTFDEIADVIEQHYNECLKTIEGEQNERII